MPIYELARLIPRLIYLVMMMLQEENSESAPGRDGSFFASGNDSTMMLTLLLYMFSIKYPDNYVVQQGIKYCQYSIKYQFNRVQIQIIVSSTDICDNIK